MLAASKSSLKHRRKHVLRPLRLYGDQALGVDNSDQCKDLWGNYIISSETLDELVSRNQIRTPLRDLI